MPLFPLHAVLFPGGLLPLRIFEPRYVDMVRRCLRGENPFGIVLIHEGTDISTAVSTAGVGTSARIVDFQPLADGLLGILCRGERRFRVVTHAVQADGLHCAQVEWLPEPPAAAMPAEYQAMVPVLRQAMASLDNVARFVESHYDDPGWVSNRFAELLPLDQLTQQRLLEMDDAVARLRLLAPIVDAARAAES
jgi:Lon protease-like protein